MRVPLPGPASGITSGHAHVCALVGGRVVCWGKNHLGQAGSAPGAPVLPVAVTGVSDVVEVAAGGDQTCARLRDGPVVCWGAHAEGDRPTLAPVAALDGAAELAVGDAFGCARLEDGGVACWGAGEFGQLGDGTRTGRAHAARVPGLGSVVQLGAGGFHACARRRDGCVPCWGLAREGQLGDGIPLPQQHALRRRSGHDDEPMRSKTYCFKRLREDLVELGLRHRRGHDMRHTMITLAREDEVDLDILKTVTHDPGKKESSSAIHAYIRY